MDVQAEILDLKLRVEGLETCGRLTGAASGADIEQGLLREINDRTKRLETEIATMKAQMATARAETIEQFAAVDVEVAAIRREVNAHFVASPGEDDYIPAQIADEFATVRSEIGQEFNAVRSELLDLGIKVDRLLKNDCM
ncbi:hypothetical protein [Nonomuraea sp. CA-141351]|uniref:hypothetical protein n=1 Tax=Nonomuraea sp. CA-141351 TaxID=3239996 RepID=UPI003D8EC525